MGFRPFVHSPAGLGLAGRIGNDSSGVSIEVEGLPSALAEFIVALERDAPPLADVRRVTVAAAPASGVAGFTIAASDGSGRRRTLVSADGATCADCLAELAACAGSPQLGRRPRAPRGGSRRHP